MEGSNKSAAPKKRVLVVEDDPDSLEFLQTVVETEGHECATARSVADAIAQCDAAPFDVVLLDFLLPDGFGLEVARHIQKGRRKTPVIAVSAYLERWDADTYRRLGIVKLIPKPYKVEQIREVLR